MVQGKWTVKIYTAFKELVKDEHQYGKELNKINIKNAFEHVESNEWAGQDLLDLIDLLIENKILDKTIKNNEKDIPVTIFSHVKKLTQLTKSIASYGVKNSTSYGPYIDLLYILQDLQLMKVQRVAHCL